MTDFQLYGLSDELLKAIDEMAYTDATEIQQKTIPALVGKDADFIGLAHTGTGKTAAFAIPLLEKTDGSLRFTQALIIAPTRELAKQIETQVCALGKYKKNINVVCVYGGSSIQNQIQQLKRPPHILIATPGRLIDLANRKVVYLKDIRTLVLDEADEMFKMGFKEEVDDILSRIEKPYNTWLFSATFPDDLKKITGKYMDHPLEYAVHSVTQINANIKHEYLISKGRNKYELLKRLIDAHQDITGIVFCRTRLGTQKLADVLLNDHYKVDALHGDMSQAQRDRVMSKFRKGQIQLLIATDVAARGLDVQRLSHIIHFDIPDDATYYTHRSGRTARAGEEGRSILFVPPSKEYVIRKFQKRLNIEFNKAKLPSDRELFFYNLKKWLGELTDNESNQNIDPEILAEVFSHLSYLSKEELIERITSHWLRSTNAGKLLNQKNKKSLRLENAKSNTKKITENKGKKGKTNGDDLMNFFVNIGYVDGFGKKDLVSFLAKQSGLSTDMIINLEIYKKHAFFDAPKDIEGKLVHRLKGLRLGNRKIRINRNQN